jgi:aspartokinase
VGERKDCSPAERIALEGLRVSGGLALMEVADRSYAGERLPRMLGELARAEISMSLFMGGETQEEIRFACCVADSDGARLKADPNRDFSTGVKFYAGVDLVALFPHGFDLKRLGLGLAALARAGIPLRGVCSSLSAITFITDHTHSDQAAAALKGYFDPGAEAS